MSHNKVYVFFPPLFPLETNMSGFVVLFKRFFPGKGRQAIPCVALGAENHPRDKKYPGGSLAVFGGAFDSKHDASTASTALRELMEEAGITMNDLCVITPADDHRLAFRRHTKMSNSWSALLPDDIGRNDFWEKRTMKNEMASLIYVPVANISAIKPDPSLPPTYPVLDVDGKQQSLQGRWLVMLQEHIELASPAIFKTDGCSKKTNPSYEPASAQRVDFARF